MPPASSKFKRNIGESLYLNSDQDILFFRNVGFGTEKPLEFIHVDSNVYIRDSVGIGTAIDRSLGGGAPALQVGGVARFDGTIGVGTASVVAGARLQVSGGTLITEHVVPGGAGGAGAFNVGSASTRYGRLYVSDAGVDISGWRMLANTTADYLEIREASSELAGMLAGSAYASNAVGIGTTFVDEGIGLAVHEGSMYVRGNVGIGTVIPRADLDIQTIKGWNLTQQLSHGTWAVGDAVSVSEDGTYLVTGTNDGRSVLIWALVAAGPAGTGSKWVFDTRIAPEWSEGMNMPGYGRSLDLTTDATRLIVGAPTETTGTARIYARSAGSPSTWSLMGDGVLGPSGSLSSGFGTDVAISRNGLYAAVTSPTEDSLGVVYIYFYSGGSWALQQRIVGPSVGGAAQFGWSIELTADGSRLFVGRQSPESVLIYNRTGTTWSQAGLLVAPDATGVDIFEFGRSVSVSTDGAVLVVGAPARNSARGAVYVWRNDVFAQRLDGSVVSGRLGDRVDIDANGRVIVANEYLFKWVDSGGGGGSGVWSEFHVFLQNHPHAANTGISVSDDGQAVFMSSPLEDRVYVFNELLEPYVEIRSREGSNLFLVQHDGRVGVGTDTALSGLHVQSTVYVASNLGIGTVNAMAPLHAVGGAVFSGGNVGIGTTAAASALNVQGVVSVTGSGGYLGIGTALPSASVHIVGSGGVGGAALRINEAFVVSANGALTADGATLGTATISSASVGSASNTELFVSNGLVMGSSARVRSELRVDSNVMADGNLVTLVANIGVGTENPGSFVDIRAQKFFVATSNLTGGVSEDTYGQVVAASADGNWLVVSDPTRTLTAVAQGLAIVYKWSGSAWQEWQSLTAASPAINDQFGRAMAFSADSSYLFIARQNQVFVYGLSGGQWVTDASLSEPSADAAAGFGRALEFSEVDQKLLVGAPLKNNTGVVFEYGHVGGLWTLSSTVSPGGGESGNIEFGASIHVSGSTRVIGAPGRTATGVLSAGSVFKYTWSAVGVTWSYVGVLSASSPTTNMRLGTSVAVSDNGDVVAGAPSAGYAGANSGAVVVFDSVSNAQKQVILSGTSSSFFGKALYAWSARPLIAVGASDAVRIYRRHGDSYREYQRLSGEGAAFASTAVGLAIGDVAGSVVRLWSLVYDRSFFEIRDEVSSNVFVVGNNGRIGVGTGAPMVGLDVRTTDAVLLPRGTTAQRPTSTERGFIRYNTETSQFEGLGAGDAWELLGGVKSTDGFTYIAAEAYAGANDSNLRFVTGAVERMIVDAGGNVGIGTGAPVVGLDVRTTDAVLLPRGTTAQRPTGVERGFIRYNTETAQFEGRGAGDTWGSLGGVKSTDGFTYIAAEAYAGANDSNLRFVTGAVERMIVSDTGYVGIGTTQPAENLHVVGDVLATGTITASNMQIIGDVVILNTVTSNTEQLVVSNSGSGPGIKVTQTGAEPIAAFYDDGALAMIIADGGNIGIGTGAPLVALDIRRNDAILLPRGTTAQRPAGVERGFIRFNTETLQFEGLGAGDVWGALGGGSGGLQSLDTLTYITAEAYPGAGDSNLRFVTGGTQRMIVDASGNVGIGTAVPEHRLDVAGDLRATHIYTCNLNVIGQTFANYDSQLFRNRLQLAPLTQTILVDVPELFNVALSMDGLYKFEARKAEVLLNGSKLAYISAGSNDFYVSYENTSSNTLVNVVLQTPAKLNDVLDVKLWPSYLDDWNVLQPGYSLQNISYVTLNDGMVIDRSITKPLQIAPYRFTEYIASGISSNQVFQWTVNGRYVFNEGNCDVYLNGVRLVSLANSAVQDFSLNYDYYFDQTRIYFTVHQTLATGDILDVTVWPDFDETTENVKGIFYQNVSYFSRVGVSSNIVFTEGNLGIGTTAPLKKLHIEDDIIFDGVMYNRAGQAIWVPGSALEWKNVVGAHPVLTAASGMTISVDSVSKRGQFKYVGNNITYNLFVEASVTDKPGPVSGDFELGLPYVVEGGAYAVGTVVGELWLTVTTAGTPGTVTIYKAYGKTAADTSKVTVRYLNGTFEESLSGLSVGTSIRLQGTLEYRTVYVADEQPLPQAYTPELFTRNASGYVGLNTQALPARGRFDVVETSNLPVLVLDQRGTGALLEMRSNANDVKVIVDRMGNVGIGTGAPRAKLEVSGSVIPSSNLAYDLGSSNLRWRDLFLSGNTIDLGGTMLKRDEAGGGGIKVLSESGEDVDTTVRNLNASGYLNIGGTRLERHVTGPIMVKTATGEMESGMFKHVYVDGTVRASNLEVLGDYVTLNTITSNTEQMVITNAGTGPGLKVTQTGAESIAEFYDDGGVLVMKVADGGKVGIGTANPSSSLTVWGSSRFGTDTNGTTTSTNYGRWQNLMDEVSPNQNLPQLFNRIQTTAALTANRTWYNIYNQHLSDALGSSISGERAVIYGTRNDIRNARTDYGTGYIYAAYGSMNYIINHASNLTSSNAIDLAHGTYNWVRQYRDGVTSNAYGTYNRIGRDAGTIVNSYGVFCTTEGTVNNSYGVYCTGEQKNYFAGNVGIGTTAPTKKLHVVGDVLTTGTLTASNVSVIGDFVTLNTVTSNTEQMVIVNAGTGPGLKVTQTGAESIAEFYDDGGVLAMKVADGGNVGIGTGAPMAKLHVHGTAGTDGIRFPDSTVQVSSARGSLALIQSGTATSALTIPISSLNGDVDIKYVLELQGTITTTADRYIYITPNNATGDTYLALQFRIDVVPATTIEKFTNKQLMIGRTVYLQTGTISITSTIFAQSGYHRSAISSCKFYASTSAAGFAEIQSTWANTSANITSMTINFDGATFTGRWRLYAPR